MTRNLAFAFHFNSQLMLLIDVWVITRLLLPFCQLVLLPAAPAPVLWHDRASAIPVLAAVYKDKGGWCEILYRCRW